jgi:Mg2+ and Co2+ transporter CorA
MKNLNESIGLGGGNGMSHFDGDFDPETDESVKAAKKGLDILKAELDNLLGPQTDYLINKRPSEIQAWYDAQFVANTDKKGNFNVLAAPAMNAGLAKLNNERTTAIDQLKKRIVEINDNLIPLASKKYQDAKIAAIEANNKIVDSKIKLLAEKAKTDPTALDQMTKLNEQKLAGEQALAKQKIEADVAKNKSSNIKIYVIIGAVVLGLAAIAGIWIWLKSRKAV